MAERKKPKPDPETVRPANGTVGETLRTAREAKKLEIDAVSKVIHIRSTQIKAIEENNIEALPGMTYAVGFVRSYANFLGLNGAEIVHRFKAEQGYNPVHSKLSFPEPVAESRVPDPMMVGVGAFLAVVILVLWTVYSNMHGGSKTADKLPPAPVVTSVADSLPPATTTAPAATTPTATEPSAVTTATPATTAATPPAPQAATTTAAQPAPTATPPVATATPAVPATAAPKTEPVAAAPAKEAAASDDADSEDENADDATASKAKDADKNQDGVINIKHGKSRITLKATEASWVQVSDVHQNILYRKVLRPGEQYSVPDQPGLSLDTANAGGLKVIVDGKSVQPLGKNGDILRGVALDPQELKNAKSQRE
jgi:cytoskeleton protein RodZ